MNKITKLLILFLILIYGCKNIEKDENLISQSIKSFNMNIYSNEGNRLYSIKSPYSSFDRENSILNLKSSAIKLFTNNKAEYIINSDKSKLSNNNKLIELNGNVIIKSLPEKTNILNANNFAWNINSSEYLLTGNVKFENDEITLSSNKATFNKESKIIEFYNPVKYIIKDKDAQNSYEINSENAYYNIETKSVIFKSNKQKVRSKIYF